MARAGHCIQCGENVWLAADGSCPKGHGPQDISRVYEAGEEVRPASAAQPLPQGRRAPIVGLAIAAAAVLLVVGVLLVAVPMLSSDPEPQPGVSPAGAQPGSVSGSPPGMPPVEEVLPGVPMIDPTAIPQAAAAADDAVCRANRAELEAAAAVYLSEHYEDGPSALSGTSWQRVLVGEVLPSAPTCPTNGGTYTLDDDGNASCADGLHNG
jgi:hypothetical protein